MSLSYEVGTRVKIVRGDHKGKVGTVQEEDGSKIVVLDSAVKLMGVNDSNTKRL